MGKNNVKVPVSVSPRFLLFVVFSLLLIPIKWVLSWLFAALVHELFHYCALCICRHAVLSVYIGAGGAQIRTEPLSDIQECFCALAGPFGGMLLLLFSTTVPMIALCAFLQSTYNLLPIYPMDGGRALCCLIRRILKPATADRVIIIWSQIIALLLVIGCVLATIRWNLGLLPIIVAIILAIRNKKSLANREGREYNVFSYGYE